MTLNARFNLKCALRTARLTYVCCGFRIRPYGIGVARGGGGVDWRAQPPPCGQLTRCFSAVAELLVGYVKSVIFHVLHFPAPAIWSFIFHVLQILGVRFAPSFSRSCKFQGCDLVRRFHGIAISSHCFFVVRLSGPANSAPPGPIGSIGTKAH